MKTVWTAGLDKQEAAEIIAAFNASGRLRERLATMLRSRIDAKRKDVISTTSYEKASWPLYQADAIGYERAVEEIISLILSKNE